jgi:hypothetical protein
MQQGYPKILKKNKEIQNVLKKEKERSKNEKAIKPLSLQILKKKRKEKKNLSLQRIREQTTGKLAIAMLLTAVTGMQTTGGQRCHLSLYVLYKCYLCLLACKLFVVANGLSSCCKRLFHSNKSQPIWGF